MTVHVCSWLLESVMKWNEGLVLPEDVNEIRRMTLIRSLYMIQMSSIKPCAAETIMCTESRVSSVIGRSYGGSLNGSESHR